MNFLTKEDILNANDLKVEEVKVPEWGGSVLVRTLTGAERDDFEISVYREDRGTDNQENFRNFRSKLTALTVVDSEGKRLFTSEDVALLGRKNASALDRVFAMAQKLAGLRPRDVEELTKNS